MKRGIPVALTLAALACSSGTPTWQQQETTNRPRQHVMVQFTDFSLHPSKAQVLEGGSVSWVNYASMDVGSIVFSDVVAESFTCTDLEPDWMKTDASYQSIPITMAGASNDLQLPCPLKPGTYHYEVWLFSGGEDGLGDMSDPDSMLRGQIVVK